ncbi:MAG: citrate/2-methylcitrate synthase [Planctomycetota bacterium]
MLGRTPQPAAPQTYGRGLENLVFGDTAICRIDGARGELSFRGYPVADLTQHCSLEQVIWLIINGDLPDAGELGAWHESLQRWREPPVGAINAIYHLPDGTSPFAAFRTALAVAAAVAPDASRRDADAQRERPARIIAWSYALAAAAIRCHQRKEPVAPRGDLPMAAHFLWQAFGAVPDEVAARAFEVSLILQSEHDIHAAALAAVAVVSAGGDLDGAVLAGVGALSGRLHGGANQTAFRLVQSFEGDVQRARSWTRERIAEKHRFPGFGHRVYKTHDPRGRALAPHARRLLERQGQSALWEVFEAVREEIESALGAKGIFANVDAFTGLIYHPLGLPVPAFTIPFCLAVQTGWMAHCLEYLGGPPLRPTALWLGEPPGA